MKAFEVRALEQSKDWTSRGDNYHWDHADGSFIELDGTRYVLYSQDCARLASTKTFSGALVAHRELSKIGAQS